jgi:AcrR family transcriptional regulator
VTETEQARRPGRPRSAAADAAIVRATLELLMEHGYRALTMEQVRSRASVGKATLYRRFGSKEELVAQAIRHLNQPLDLPDTGATRSDILAVARAVQAGAERVQFANFIPRMLADAAGDPEMHAIFYENLVAPRRAVMGEVLRRGVARGELRADLDVELAIDIIVGPWVYRLLIAGNDATELYRADPSALLDLVLVGLTPRPGGDARDAFTG